jgi:hypothetical protein
MLVKPAQQQQQRQQKQQHQHGGVSKPYRTFSLTTQALEEAHLHS